MPKQNRQSLSARLSRILQVLTFGHTHVSDNSKLATSVADDAHDESLKAENILLEEFKFASAYALQTLQDRAGTFNLYFVLIGIVATGIGLIYQFGQNTIAYLPWIVFILLVTVGIVHLFFAGRLASLEAQYHTYVERMNGIRNFYTLQFNKKLPSIADVLRPIPRKDPIMKFFNLSRGSLACILTGSICFAGAAFVLTGIWANLYNGTLFLRVFDMPPYIGGIIIGLTSFWLSYSVVQNKDRSV